MRIEPASLLEEESSNHQRMTFDDDGQWTADKGLLQDDELWSGPQLVAYGDDKRS
jgi:hypothetical protein